MLDLLILIVSNAVLLPGGLLAGYFIGGRWGGVVMVCFFTILFYNNTLGVMLGKSDVGWVRWLVPLVMLLGAMSLAGYIFQANGVVNFINLIASPARYVVRNWQSLAVVGSIAGALLGCAHWFIKGPSVRAR
jgi:hypothetical protein